MMTAQSSAHRPAGLESAMARCVISVAGERHGYGIAVHEGRADCEQAYRRAWDFHPDIVVTDLTLRGGDGWQLIQDLKGEPRTREIPVVLLTGHAEPSLRERAEHEGCAGFFVKPCLPDELATELRHVLDGTIADEGDSTSL